MSKKALLVAVALAACTSQATPTTTTTAEPTGPGSLVVVDGEGDIVVVEADGTDSEEVMLSTDEIGLAQPIWSPDGTRLSWAQAGPEGFSYVIHDLGTGAFREVTLEQYPFYAYWSPANDRVGVLRNGPDTVVFETITVADGRVQAVGDDTPFYFSWNPSGDRVAAHAGPVRLLDIGFEEDDGEPGRTDDGYLAPQWLSGGVLHVVDSELVLEGEDGTTSLAEVSGLTTFVANPQGDLVAVQSISAGGGESVAFSEAAATQPNAVMVVDVETGDLTTVSESPALAFFWSPDGRRLLILALNETRDGLLPLVWSRNGLSQYSEYRPSPVQVQDLFPFFPQYAQSLSFWAADSSAFVVVGEIDGDAGVWVHALDGGDPRLVSSGTWAAWSP